MSKDKKKANPSGRMGVAGGELTNTKRQDQEQFNEVGRNIEGVIGLFNPPNHWAMRNGLWRTALIEGVLCDDC